MVFSDLLTIELLPWFLVVTSVLLLGFCWYRMRLMTAQYRDSQINASSQKHEYELQLQSYEHLRARADELSKQCEAAQLELDNVRNRESQQRSELAVLKSANEEYVELKASCAEKEADLSKLRSELSRVNAVHDSEKSALEEKLTMLKEAREQLNAEFKALANQIFEEKQRQFNEQSQVAIKASVDPLKTQIDSFRKKVEDAYDKENAERNKLVGSIAELQKQTLKIGEDAINLTNALKGDNKAQGNWGEVILERLLEESGLQKGRGYEVQVGLKDEQGRRRNPDVILRLPEGKDIVIDSKVSLVNYETSVSATDDTERAAALKQHVAAVRTHIQQLSSKSYEKLEGIRSLDFVFLFVPVEAAFMCALQEDPGLFQDAYAKHIVLVSPTTLLASLRTVENIWRYEKQNRNAEEIARQAGGLHDQFVLLFESFEEIGKQLDKAGVAFETTRKRWVSGRGNLMRRVDGLRELGAKTKKRVALGEADDSGVDTSIGSLEASAIVPVDKGTNTAKESNLD